MLGKDQKTELAVKLDQLWGWAKAGKTEEYYLMDIENVDTFTNDVLKLVDQLIREKED